MATGTLCMALALLTPGGAPADCFPINQRNFQIPIHIDPSRRAEMKQLLLYCSADQGKNWQQVAVASPDKEYFQFYAPADGLYWFTVCVMDQRGNREPADVSKAPPAQKILVDTTKPLLRLSAERQGEDAVVSWELQEDHPDLSTMKLEYRAGEAPAGQWAAAPLTAATSGQTRIRIGAGAAAVRMQVQDLAANVATAGAEVGAAAGSAAPGLPPNMAAAASPAAAGPAWDVQRASPALPPGRAETAAGPDLKYGGSGADRPSAPASVPGGRLLASSESSDGGVTPASMTTTGRPAGAPLPPVQFVRDTQIPIDYEIVKQGPSGIGRVELWITRNDGRSWELYGENTDPKPPLLVDVHNEGQYGFRLVVQSRAGLGKHPPMPGDPPEIRVEVDTTPPVAKLFAPEPDPHRHDALVINWLVSDKNLDANPIGLQWAEHADGTWQTIEDSLPNTGKHTWVLPPNLPIRVYLRLTARDTAGNVSQAVTPEPILVDLTEPEVRIKGLAGGARR